MDKLEAAPVSVLDRFTFEVQLACPLFQRRYVWEKSNVEQLFADLDTVLDGTYSKRFLGALVFNNETAPTSTAAGRYWIIDGQQRLTTLYLILVAIAELSAGLGDEGKDLARETFDSYLVSARPATKGKPRLAPTLVDMRQFERIVSDAATVSAAHVAVTPNLSVGDETGKMSEAYRLIKRLLTSRVASLTGSDTSSALEALGALQQIRKTILEDLELVEIRLGGEHDPNEVFDRLNNVGQRLSILDLVRNEALKHLDSDPHIAREIYSQDWKPFEDGFASDDAARRYFFPFVLTIDESATQAKTFSTLAERWRKQIAELDAENSSMQKSHAVQEIVRDLRKHQSAFNAIHDGRYEKLDEPLRTRVKRLNDLNRPSSVYPYVMQLLTSTAEGDTTLTNAAACLDVVEAFLVRRGITGLEPTGLHAVFKRLWSNAGDNAAAVRESIVSKTVVYPSDEVVKEAIRTGDLYHRRICRYVIEEFERAISMVDVLETLPRITIDHILPQSYQGTWRDSFSKEEHESLVHTWGNLVPLSSPGNSMKGTKGWAGAKALLELETVFSTTKQIYATHTDWTPKDIRARNRELAEWAVTRWPEFGSSASAIDPTDSYSPLIP